MINNVIRINYNEIPQLSSKDKMYQLGHDAYNGFYKYTPNIESFKEVIEERKKFKTNRELLVETLIRQYEKDTIPEAVKEKIELIRSENTFTITTAHQPVLFMGPLYMVYKIISAIHLCTSLKKKYTDYNFVPVFVSGGEDHDLEEVATMHIFNRDITWQTVQTGSVGRMSKDDLNTAIDELVSMFGKSPFASELESIIKQCYDSAQSYGEFNINFYKKLFSELGLVVLNMDDSSLKEHFLPYAIKEIEEKISFKTVTETQKKLAENGIKEQAHVRDINLFLFGKGSRDRIVANGSSYVVGKKEYSSSELMNFIQSNPESISPNVVTRPIYQELILPNLAYIGGGGEIAYWLERMSQFSAFGLPFPMLIRRNSALIVPTGIKKNLNKVDMHSHEFFQGNDELVKYYLANNTDEDYSLSAETQELESLFQRLSQKAKSIDQSLEKFTLAEGAKQAKALKGISSKMTKAAKSKNEVQLQKIQNIKSKLFPSGKLQERYDNFIPYYLKYGKEWFNTLLEHLDPMEKDFLILEE